MVVLHCLVFAFVSFTYFALHLCAPHFLFSHYFVCSSLVFFLTCYSSLVFPYLFSLTCFSLACLSLSCLSLACLLLRCLSLTFLHGCCSLVCPSLVFPSLSSPSLVIISLNFPLLVLYHTCLISLSLVCHSLK